MKNISFSMTTPQIRDRSKTVTRRLGWERLKAGDTLKACVKCQGIKAGELERLGPIRVVSVSREELGVITASDVTREGFPAMTPAEFITRFIGHYGERVINSKSIVTRIEFEYID